MIVSVQGQFQAALGRSQASPGKRAESFHFLYTLAVPMKSDDGSAAIQAFSVIETVQRPTSRSASPRYLPDLRRAAEEMALTFTS
jgi:hypothetical protein